MISRIIFITGILVFILLFPLQALTNDDGAPANSTGAPGNDTCSADGCHETNPINVGPGSVTVTTNDSYTPGETMNFTVRVEQAGQSRFGFQATVRPVNDPYRFTGKLGLGQGTIFSDAIQRYITHDEAVSINDANEWTFQWTAPEENVGAVQVYIAGVAGDGNGRNTNDYVYTDSMTIPVHVSVEEVLIPEAFSLEQAYPNPFTSQAEIKFNMQRPEPVEVHFYDMLGRMVKQIDAGTRATGSHSIRVDGSDFPAGVYFYEVRTPSTQKSGSIIKQ